MKISFKQLGRPKPLIILLILYLKVETCKGPSHRLMVQGFLVFVQLPSHNVCMQVKTFHVDSISVNPCAIKRIGTSKYIEMD